MFFSTSSVSSETQSRIAIGLSTPDATVQEEALSRFLQPMFPQDQAMHLARIQQNILNALEHFHIDDCALLHRAIAATAPHLSDDLLYPVLNQLMELFIKQKEGSSIAKLGQIVQSIKSQLLEIQQERLSEHLQTLIEKEPSLLQYDALVSLIDLQSPKMSALINHLYLVLHATQNREHLKTLVEIYPHLSPSQKQGLLEICAQKTDLDWIAFNSYLLKRVDSLSEVRVRKIIGFLLSSIHALTPSMISNEALVLLAPYLNGEELNNMAGCLLSLLNTTENQTRSAGDSFELRRAAAICLVSFSSFFSQEQNASFRHPLYAMLTNKEADSEERSAAALAIGSLTAHSPSQEQANEATIQIIQALKEKLMSTSRLSIGIHALSSVVSGRSSTRNTPKSTLHFDYITLYYVRALRTLLPFVSHQQAQEVAVILQNLLPLNTLSPDIYQEVTQSLAYIGLLEPTPNQSMIDFLSADPRQILAHTLFPPKATSGVEQHMEQRDESDYNEGTACTIF